MKLQSRPVCASLSPVAPVREGKGSWASRLAPLKAACVPSTDPGSSSVCTCPTKLSSGVPWQPRKARGACVALSWLDVHSFEIFS